MEEAGSERMTPDEWKAWLFEKGDWDLAKKKPSFKEYPLPSWMRKDERRE